jgi:hypothetical protein
MDWRDFVTIKIMHVFTRLRLIRILNLSASKHRLSDFFKGLENVEAVRQIFGERTEQVLRDLTVELTWIGGYMWVNASDGHLMIDSRYLSKGDRVDIYLDIIHELVHVRQLMEGKELFDVGYSYVERPTEVEAYRYAVNEAKRLGLSNKRICEYLKTEWMSDDDVKRLAKTLNIECT